ncbi:hypothetical protein AVEN_93424-1 [Araneus ventricosus]|uniref:RNA-directed DNA polymerase n=1 Tax=Araneus ventricosus TaxID=182803 RepID=A0A4Y2APG5_ARAVE|nr:hypothetical protein AVEN_93424-1 [Araneus ventricosus]
MLVDTGANVTLVRTDLAQKLKGNFIYTAPNISLKTATGEKAEIHGKLDAAIECGSRKLQHKIYVADITDPCILGLDFLQKFNFMVDLERNEIRTGGEEIPLFSASAEDSKLCSVLAKEKTIIPARSECLIQGVPEASGKFRYAVTDFPSQVSQKGVLVAATLVDLKKEATRFCVDYRKLNEITMKDSYPLQRIDDTLDALNGSQWFSTLDLKSGYWQVEIQPEDKEKTAFTTGKDSGNLREPEGQIARWIQRLQEYDFEIQHRKGTSHGNADALSRRPCKESCKHCTNAEKKFGMETDISVKVLTIDDAWSSSEVQKAQLEDPAIRPILERKLNSEDRTSWQEIAPESPATKRYWALWDSLHLKDGVLNHKWESDDGSSCRWQLILPKSRIQEVLRETHDSASGGHFGVMKTLSKTREGFYSDRLRADVEKWCR